MSLLFLSTILIGAACVRSPKTPVASQPFTPSPVVSSVSNDVVTNGIVISGEYYVDGYLGEICFMANKESQQLLPVGAASHFCFTNQNEASTQLYGVEFGTLNLSGDFPAQSATIRVVNYSMKATEVGSFDGAELVEVIRKSNP